MIRRSVLIAAVALVMTACATHMAVPAKRVYFVEPADGAVVGTTFKVKFGVAGMDLKPAGDETPNSGHHHVLVNMESMPAGQAIPFSPTHIHFGKAQTEGEIKLTPGVYKLTMQFANKDHVSYGKEMATSITVTVK